MVTTFDVAAQYGGPDSGAAFQPHFRALKRALKGRTFEGFPFPELTFILRVDGSFVSFGPPGPGNIDIDKKQEYVSVDIVIARADWMGREMSDVSRVVGDTILSGVRLLQESRSARLSGTDWAAVSCEVAAFVDSYREEVHHAV